MHKPRSWSEWFYHRSQPSRLWLTPRNSRWEKIDGWLDGPKIRFTPQFNPGWQD